MIVGRLTSTPLTILQTMELHGHLYGQCDVSGCMDSDAYNYNPQATIDDGFCLFTTGGVNSCPTDITGDGVTNVADLLAMLGGIGTSCQ